MNRKPVERGPRAGRRDRAPAMHAVRPGKNPSAHQHSRYCSYSTLTLSWMNTGRDKREVRERDRQGQSNNERLFFQRHSFVFYWFKMIFWSEKVDYRYFYGIFVFMYHFKCLNTF